MTRFPAALACLALVAVSVPVTFSAFTETQVNAATIATQTVFPPLNTSLPTVTSATVAGVTTLTGARGEWTTVNGGTSTYTLQWQRCSGDTCVDVGDPLTLDLNNLTATLVHTVTAADSGSSLQLKVTGADSSITGAGERNSTVAYSVPVAIL